MQEFITVRQFAERFNMPISTVYKYMNNHTIPSIKIGRSRKIDIAQADKFIINDGVVCSLPKEGAKNMTIKDMIRKPLTATGTICSSRSSNGKVKWYLRKFPLRYKNQRGDIEYAQHPGFETREQAERFRKLCIKERNRLDELSFDNPSVYEEFKKYVKLYREPNWENQSTSDNMTSFIENHLKPVFEYIGIKDVTTDDLQAFYLRQNKVRDVKKPLSIMRKFFDRLYRHKKISYDPCCDVSIPTHVSLHPQNRTPLSKQEEEAFF
jgi:excisionase family DNA binding protein